VAPVFVRIMFVKLYPFTYRAEKNKKMIGNTF